MSLLLKDKGSRAKIRMHITALFIAVKFFTRKVPAQFG
jgi:hypothetical protein